MLNRLKKRLVRIRIDIAFTVRHVVSKNFVSSSSNTTQENVLLRQKRDLALNREILERILRKNVFNDPI